MYRSREKGTPQVNGNSTVSLVVEGGGDGVVGHVGLGAFGAFADRVGLGDCLSERIPSRGERWWTHDRGKVVVQTMLMLAGGGEACTDIEHLRSQPGLFGWVPSDSTVWRTFNDDITPQVRAELWGAVAEVRAQVWARMTATLGPDPVVLDIDASLHEIHSENKDGAAPHFKRGFGFHPIYCTADATGEVMGVTLRPGNAGSNTIVDHVDVLDQAIAGLPAQVAAGHRVGDNPDTVERTVRVRTDHRPQREPGLARHGLFRRRPRPLVPTAVLSRPLGHRRTENVALGSVAHPRPDHPPLPPDHHPNPRRMAVDGRHSLRPPTDRHAHLTHPDKTASAMTATVSSATPKTGFRA